MSVDELKDRLVTRIAGPDASPGVVATLGRASRSAGRPWREVGVPADDGRVRRWRRRTLEADLDDPGIWSVTCFVVRTGHRRQGIAGVLLAAAVEHARASGAHTLEGYPLDPEVGRFSSADLYRGTVSLFEAAGFDVVARPKGDRAVVRLAL